MVQLLPSEVIVQVFISSLADIIVVLSKVNEVTLVGIKQTRYDKTFVRNFFVYVCRDPLVLIGTIFNDTEQSESFWLLVSLISRKSLYK